MTTLGVLWVSHKRHSLLNTLNLHHLVSLSVWRVGNSDLIPICEGLLSFLYTLLRNWLHSITQEDILYCMFRKIINIPSNTVVHSHCGAILTCHNSVDVSHFLYITSLPPQASSLTLLCSTVNSKSPVLHAGIRAIKMNFTNQKHRDQQQKFHIIFRGLFIRTCCKSIAHNCTQLTVLCKRVRGHEHLCQ